MYGHWYDIVRNMKTVMSHYCYEVAYPSYSAIGETAELAR